MGLRRLFKNYLYRKKFDISSKENVALNLIDILENADSLNGKFIDLNKKELTW